MKKIIIKKKKPMFGHNVSHSNRKTKRRFNPNIQTYKIWIDSEKKFAKIKTTKKILKTIDKIGIEKAIK